MKIKHVVVLTALLLFVVSCQQKPNIEYKYQDKPEVVDCPGINSELIHEALYSFEFDLGTAYNYRRYMPSMPVFFQNGYASFIYHGSEGNADYKRIASPHTVKVFNELLKIEGLWDLDNERSHLNYNHEFVECLLSNIKNDDIKNTIASLREINSMSPKMMAEPYRRYVGSAYSDDKYFAMYVALDTFYQYLVDEDLEEETEEAIANE